MLAGAAGILAQVAQPPGSVAGNGDAVATFGGAIRYAEPDDVEILPHALDAGWNGEKTCELLQGTEEMRMFKCVFAPGEGHERHYHPPHVGYIIEGGVMRITDETGVREQETPAGASWSSDGVNWHEAVNIGATTTSYVIIEPKGARQ